MHIDSWIHALPVKTRGDTRTKQEQKTNQFDAWEPVAMATAVAVEWRTESVKRFGDAIRRRETARIDSDSSSIYLKYSRQSSEAHRLQCAQTPGWYCNVAVVSIVPLAHSTGSWRLITLLQFYYCLYYDISTFWHEQWCHGKRLISQKHDRWYDTKPDPLYRVMHSRPPQ